MAETVIRRGQFVGSTYPIRDGQGEIVELSDMPITYIHGGRHEIFPQIETARHGRQLDDLVEVPIGYKDVFGENDQDLPFTDDLQNAPQEYRFVGAEILLSSLRSSAPTWSFLKKA